MKVLIADKTAEECRDKLQEFSGIEVITRIGMTPEELIAEIGGYQALIVRSATRVTRKVIESAAELKVIGRAGAGVDNIDVAAAAERFIPVLNTPGGNSGAVAELVIGMMFALSRHIPRADASMKAGKWEKKALMGSELAGKTLGIIGIGNVGAKVTGMAKALQIKVLAYDPYVSAERIAGMGLKSSGLDELLHHSDYISIHVPGSEETTGFVNKGLFAKMKKGVFFINCARGGIVVEEDLLKALEEGWVAGAAVDVYEQEPPADYSLAGHLKVIATPHIGASSKEAQVIVAVMIAEQIGKYLTSGEVINQVKVK